VVVVVDGGGTVSATCTDVPRDGVAAAGSWISAMSSGGWVVVEVVVEVEVEVEVELVVEVVEVVEASSVKRPLAEGAVVVGPFVVVVVEHGSIVVLVDSTVVDPASVVVVDDSVVDGAQLASTAAADVVPAVVSALAAVAPTNNVKPATVIAAVLPNNERIDGPA
jgi:hypothetical protein